jgi:hypothetical protein
MLVLVRIHIAAQDVGGVPYFSSNLAAVVLFAATQFSSRPSFTRSIMSAKSQSRASQILRSISVVTL